MKGTEFIVRIPAAPARSIHMSSRILLVEDEPGPVLTLSDLLRAEGYAVESATDGPTGLARALNESFRLDRPRCDVARQERPGGLPRAAAARKGRGGPHAHRQRHNSSIAVVGLKLGADDYLTKPFEPPELLARIGSLAAPREQRKAHSGARLPVRATSMSISKRATCARMACPSPWPQKRSNCSVYLIDHRGKVVSRDELLEGVWEYQPGVSSRTIDVHVACCARSWKTIRRPPGTSIRVRGVGYRFSA